MAEVAEAVLEKQRTLPSDDNSKVSDGANQNERSGFNIKNQDVNDVVETAEGTEEEHKYVTGVKLGVAISSTTIVVFLMMLDLSIIVTVGNNHNTEYKRMILKSSIGNPIHYKPLSFVARCRMVWERLPIGKVSQPNVLTYEKSNYPSCSLQPLTGKIYISFNTKVSFAIPHSQITV